MLETGITSLSGYLPRRRLARKAIVDANKWANPALASMSNGHRAICAHDEDSLTMGVEAARYCIANADPVDFELIQFASTTLPFADRSNSVFISEALTLGPDIRCMDSAGFLGCGIAALINALQSEKPTLTIASDKRMAKIASAQELTLGDGAAAIATGTHKLIARLLASHSTAEDFVDHYRSAQATTDYQLEERWVRDEGQLKMVPPAIAALLHKSNCQLDEIDHFVITGVSRAAARQITKTCAIADDKMVDSLDAECGNTGSAHPLIMLCHAIENAQPGEKILVVNVAQGCQSLLFETTDTLTSWKAGHSIQSQINGGVEDTNYLRFLAFNEQIDVDWGIRAEKDNRTALSAFNRHRKTVTSFIGGICTKCGTKQFPKGQCCVNPDCRTFDTLIDEPFQHKTGKVKSFTEDWLAISVNPPLMYGNVTFEDGGVIMMEFADFGTGALNVGLPVRFAFRIKDKDPKRQFQRYFWKAIPAHTQEAR